MTDTTYTALRMAPDDPTALRLRARRRAEWRMKVYGIAAITFAMLALLALLSSVIVSASGAVRETYVPLEITLTEADIDPDRTGDPAIIRRADFSGLTKTLMRDTFPHVKDRKLRRQLNDVLSVGAGFELADHVAANPDLIGQTITFDFLASDVTDLYLQGSYGALEPQPVSGTLNVTPNGKLLDIRSTGRDFAEVLEIVKRDLTTQADRLRGQAALQNNGVVVLQRRADVATTDEDREGALAEVASRSAQRDALIAQADALDERATRSGGDEKLGRTLPSLLINVAGGWIKLASITPQKATGTILSPLQGEVTEASDWTLFKTTESEQARKISDAQIVWVETLRAEGKIKRVWNTRFLSSGDSREPELAGIWGATVGTFWTMLVTFGLAFPIGVAAAIYLEEFAKKSRVTDLIEVNINNLAAVPSIVFGLLGLAAFIQFFGVPRSAPLAGGMVLALMTLPTIIIASRAALKSVPPSIREAALGVGASRMQTVFHHVLPLAMPGMLTGAIIGMARALGESAPLLMIGMIAFIVEVPGSPLDPATALPVQVYLWADSPERAFAERTSAAIIVLLAFLLVMNVTAVWLRNRFERRW